MIFPCVDLMAGKVVQLVQGKRENLEIEIDDVAGLVKEFSGYGELQVIDLDAAMDKGDNSDLIKKICKIARCRVGGGIRTAEKAEEAIKLGATKVILGSAVFKGNKINIDLLKKVVSKIKKERVIIAIDSLKGNIVTKGWTNDTKIRTEDAIKQLEPYCSEFLYTYVDKEGTLQGINIGIIRKLKKLTKNQITAAGGINSIEQIKELEKIKVNSALGMVLYTGKVKLEDLKKL